MPANNSQGCELDESLRRYYLDAMGVQVWEQQSPVTLQKVDKVEEVSNAKPSPETDPWLMLQQEVAECTACAFHNSRQQSVFGTGSRQADLMIIGVAPDDADDAQGEPFVGAEGELLAAMLKAIDIDYNQVYLTNLIKCRPPSSAEVAGKEVNACSSFLQRQIILVQPKMILLMGRQAGGLLLNTADEMSSLRLKLHQYATVPMRLTYHPSELLQQAELKRDAWQDLQQLKRELESCQ